jgi:hypothetical protein
VQYKYLRVHSKIIDGRCCAARPCSSIASLVVGSHGLGLGFGLEGPAWPWPCGMALASRFFKRDRYSGLREN